MAVVGTLAVAVVAFVATGLIFPDSLPGQWLRGATIQGGQYPRFGQAVVDGSMSEWDLAADFFGEMYRNEDGGAKVESNLYLRYDCDGSTLFVLVLAAGDWPVLTEEAESWVAVENAGNKITSTSFAWIEQAYNGQSEHAKGWEASFSISEGDYSLWAHTKVFDEGIEQSSGTIGSGLGMTLDCAPAVRTSVTSFSAKKRTSDIIVRWDTTDEVNNAGFKLYHSDNNSGPWTALNQDLIPSQSPSGGSYRWIHRGIDLNATHFYRLEDVDHDGTATSHGPVSP